MAKQTFTTGQVLTTAQMTTLQTNDYNQTVSAKVASYTLVAADAGTRITMSNASATTITVNTGLFTAGDTLIITNIGAGVCTITAGTATVSTAGSLALNQYDSGTLYFTSTGVSIWNGANPGDITAVTAGTGISGGGTSGAVTVTNSMATAITTNGDIIYGTGSGTFSRLGIGSSAQVLTVSGGAPTWATPAGGGGKVLQVVSTTYQTQVSSTSTSMVDSGLTLSITPTLNTSKVLVLVSQHMLATNSSSNNSGWQWQLLRGSTNISGGSVPNNGTFYIQLGAGGFFAQLNALVNYHYLDAPATTSSTTYKTQFTGDSGWTFYAQQGSRQSTLILMEIGA